MKQIIFFFIALVFFMGAFPLKKQFEVTQYDQISISQGDEAHSPTSCEKLKKFGFKKNRLNKRIKLPRNLALSVKTPIYNLSFEILAFTKTPTLTNHFEYHRLEKPPTV